MIWPTMKRTPQKLKRPRKEPKPSLKLCKRERENLAPNFPFPHLRQITLPELVVRPVLFLLLVVIFVPKVDTQGTFSEAPICAFDAERVVTGPALAPPKIISTIRKVVKPIVFLKQSINNRIFPQFFFPYKGKTWMQPSDACLETVSG